MSDALPPQPAAVTPPDLASSPELPQVRLYRVSGVGLGTFLGSPLAGGLLLAANARRMGDVAAARRDLLLFGAMTMALLAIALASLYFQDGMWPKMAMRVGAIGGLAATIAYARKEQGDRIARHMAIGGRTESNWKAAGIGVLSLFGILLFAGVVGGALSVAGVLNIDSAGHVVRALPAPAEITPAPGWIVVQNDKQEDHVTYGIKRFHHGAQEASVIVLIGARDDLSLKDAFDDVIQQIDEQMPSPPVDAPATIEFQIHGKPALRSDVAFDLDGTRVRQQIVMTYGDTQACILEYTARDDKFSIYMADAGAIRDSLKCP